MARTISSAAVAAVIAAIVVLALQGDEDSSFGGATTQGAAGESAEAVRHLREEFATERTERMALAARVARLEESARTTRAAEPEATAQIERAEPAAVSSRPSERRFPEDRLLAAGFSRAEVRAYRERMDGIELERLYLRDRAAREGWLGTSRYARESGELSQALLETRNEFGDELYDWTLYASGRPNRVIVAEVMDGSPAASAGLEEGDVLVRYGDRNIFNAMELREETLAGRAGENTGVEVVRRGERLRIFVPRGPLGVRTDMVLREPTG